MNQREGPCLAIDLDESFEVGHCHTQNTSRFQYAIPFAKDGYHFDSIEVLENMARVNYAGDAIRKHRQSSDVVLMIDVWNVCKVHVHESWNVPVPAAQV